MQIGIIGLGGMGGNICRRRMKAGHHCVVFDTNARPREAPAKKGAEGSDILRNTDSQDLPEDERLVLDPEPKPKELQGHSAAQNTAE